MEEKKKAVLSIIAQQCLYDLAEYAKPTDGDLFERLEGMAVWLESFSSPVTANEDNEGELSRDVRSQLKDLLDKIV